MTQQQHPAGWYSQPDGSTRYWDGHQWDEHTGNSRGAANLTPKKPWFKKKRFLIPIALVVLFGALIPKGGDDESAAPAPAASTNVSASAEAAVAVETSDPQEQERLESEAAKAEAEAKAAAEAEAQRKAEEESKRKAEQESQRKAEEEARKAEEEARKAEEAKRKAELTDPASYAKISSRDWKLLERDPDSHAGERYVIHGYVTQSDSNTAPAFRADTDGVRHEDWYDYDINTIVMPGEGVDTNVVTDDMVTMYVEVTGAYNYNTSIGGTATAVMVTVHILDITEAAE